jgi:hypothetical protein
MLPRITVCSTDSPSMEGNGRIPLLLLKALLDLLETYAKEETLADTCGTDRELTVNQAYSTVVG